MLKASLEKVENGELDPYSAAAEVLSNKALVKDWTSRIIEEI
jgi:hypothetical protein